MENSDKDNKLKWNERDWKWVIGILISIIILILTLRLGDNQDVINLFSFISSSVSIALALVAIFIALKQDGESRRVNYLTTRILNSIELKLNNVDENLRRIDDKFIRNVTEEAIEDITSEGGEKDNYTKDEVKDILNSLSIEITKEINNELNKDKRRTQYIPNQGLMSKAYLEHLVFLAKRILMDSPGLTIADLKDELYKRYGYDLEYDIVGRIKGRALISNSKQEKNDNNTP